MQSNTLRVIIETPKMSFIKRKDDGSIDYISPFPCPFNYGSVPGSIADDGDRSDAIVLGKRLKQGSLIEEIPIVGVVRFIDAGKDDKKYICSNSEISSIDRITIIGFFSFYSFAKKILNKLRGKKELTCFVGLE